MSHSLNSGQAARRILFPQKKGIALLILNFIVLSSLTIFIVVWLRAEIGKEEQASFTTQTNAIIVALTERLHVYEALLYSGKGLIDSNNASITPDQWHAYVQSLQLSKHYPAVATFGYGFLVTQAEKASFLAKMRQELGPTFTITPSGNRPLYAVGTYLEPPNPAAEGIDSLVDPIRATSIHEAIATREITVSGKTSLYIDTVKVPAFVMRIVFYKQKAAAGYVTATFRMQDLIQVALQHNFQGVRFAVYDGTDTKNLNASRLFYNNLPSSWQTSGRFTRAVTLPIFSHGWTFVFTDTSLLSIRDRFAPTIILAVGFLFTMISTLLFYTLLMRKRFAEKIAEEMTEELRRSEQKYRTIFETLQDVYYETDTNGCITTVSPSIETYTGIPAQEILGKKATDFYIKPEERKYLLETLQRQGYIFDYEVSLKGKDGVPLAVSVTSKVLHDESGAIIGVAGMLRDITRRKVAEEELAKLVGKLKADKKKLEEAMTKDEFLSMAAHELRTPLGAMRWRIEEMLGGRLSPSVKNDMEKNYANVLRLTHIVNNLLNVSRINQEKIQDHPTKVDVAVLVKTVTDNFESQMKEKKIEFVFEKPKEPVVLQIDQNLLEEILINLLSNAIKYNKPGGKVALHLSSTPKEVMIRVEDTGIGIPKKDQTTIFQKFKRGSNVTSDAYEGTGLGLFVVKNYIDHWKGKIRLESKEGKGTTITLAIPIRRR